MPVSLKVRNVDKLERALADAVGARPTIRVALLIHGPAAKYFLVWEWGSARITQPGPKTTWGVNPDGDAAILTKTAPYGYIRINQPEFRRIIREELSKENWSRVVPAQIRFFVKAALDRAARRCAAVIANAAPYDTGQLAAAIETVDVQPDVTATGITDTLSVRPRLNVRVR